MRSADREALPRFASLFALNVQQTEYLHYRQPGADIPHKMVKRDERGVEEALKGA
jgi:hypothetical protein